MKQISQRGFSLLELLVALFVVVIVTSLVTLSVDSGGQDIQLDGKVRSLADVSSYALDEAQMRGVDMGLLLEYDTSSSEPFYRFSWRERTPRGWQRPAIDADIFADQQFPDNIELTLELEGVALDLSPEMELTQNTDELDPTARVNVPQVIFYSSGEVSEGVITLRSEETGDIVWQIAWDLLGRFTLRRRGEMHDDA